MRVIRAATTLLVVAFTLGGASPAPVPLPPIRAALSEVTAATGRLYPGAAVLLVHDGTTLAHTATGTATTSTVFDIASVTKLFTATVVMALVEDGRIGLDDPVAEHVPEFGKPAITVRHLLTHTSGLEADAPLWRERPDRDSRLAAVLARAPIAPLGTHIYSDLGMIVLGVLVERTAGPLDEVVAARITRPLGLADTSFRPRDPSRTAPTEVQTDPPRGLVHGEVHDENAWALGGVAGHAGLFSTTADLARFAQALLDGGGGVLRESTVRTMLDEGLGFERDQPWYMGELSGPRAVGHTGFTGTMLVIDRDTRSIAVLLTNRVHPTRAAGSINPVRRAVSTGLARALR